MYKVAQGLLLTNETIAEMNDLVNKSVQFTCLSATFARVMHNTMARMMAAGFKDTNGSLHELDSNAQDFAQRILDETEQFTKKQLEVEQRQVQQEEIDAEQTKRIECLEESQTR